MDPLRKGIAIGMLFGSGGGGNLMEKTAYENGVYDPADEIDPETEEPFDPPKDGYSLFTVDVPLDDKAVALSTSDLTSSQTGSFEYDPHDEDPELEGYSLFTVDLSDIKDDIEDLQAKIDAINQILEDHNPDYNPTEDDPVTEVGNDVEELEEKEELCEKVQEAIEEETGEPVVDPTDIPDIIHELPGYTFPQGTDPNKIQEMTGQQDVVTDTNTGLQIRLRHAIIADDTTTIIAEVDFFALTRAADYQGGRYNSYWLEYKDATHPQWTYFAPGYEGGQTAPVWSQGSYTQVDSATIDYQSGTVTWLISVGVTSMSQRTYWGQKNVFIGYGDTSHVYKVTNN